MGKRADNGIIAKTEGVSLPDWWKSGIVFVATVLRVYRLDHLTEFLGDQGRTLSVLYTWFHHGIVPLSGPTTLTGQPLGPVFYYLLVPGYLLTGGPIGISFWVAILGVVSVVILYGLVRQMFGVWPARLTALLWAVSPLIVSSDRVIWEPNLVPLFALLYTYLLYKAHRSQKTVWWILTGAVVGILIQLHYPNIVFAGLSAVYAAYVLMLRLRKPREIAAAMVWMALGFMVVCLPFLWYEYTVGFRDIAGVAGVFMGTGGTHVGKMAAITHAQDYAFRIFAIAFPYMSAIRAVVLCVLWLIFVCIRHTRRNLFITLWYAVGLAGMSTYSGIVYNHYLFFMTPVPFLMLASVLSEAKRPVVIAGFSFIIGALCIIQLSKTDAFAAENNDIYRTSAAVSAITREAAGRPFSFTLVKSASFSDLHYRYYFDTANVVPVPITDTQYAKLFLVCDTSECPSVSDINSQERLPVMCYDPHCAEFYPTIDMLRDWVYDQSIPVTVQGTDAATIYEYHRK